MSERIVLPTDGGSAGLAAARWVADRASRGPIRVELVTVTPARVRASTSAPPRPDGTAECRDVLEASPSGCVVTETVRRGDPVGEVLGAAEDADLIVIGSHPASGLATIFDLTLPLRLAGRIRRPLVVVPERWTAPGGGPVVVGWDDDGSADAAIDLAAREAAAARLPLRLLHTWVLPPSDPYDPSTSEQLHTQAYEAQRRFVDRQSERLREQHPALVVEPSLTTHAASSALAYADAKASLIVIGMHQRGPLGDLLLGSVGEDLIRAASCPVMIVPPLESGAER